MLNHHNVITCLSISYVIIGNIEITTSVLKKFGISKSEEIKHSLVIEMIQEHLMKFQIRRQMILTAIMKRRSYLPVMKD